MFTVSLRALVSTLYISPAHDVILCYCLLVSTVIGFDEHISNFFTRVLIVDWDIHHGNGTQHLFESDPRYGFKLTKITECRSANYYT